MVYLAVARRIGRLEVVRRCGTADIVVSWVPEDDEEHGGLGSPNVEWASHKLQAGINSGES